MIELRPISATDAEVLSNMYNMSLEDVDKLTEHSNTELFEDKYFKMFAVLNGEICVGTVSLYEHSAFVVSIGPDIFKEYRQRGYATDAMKAAMDIARSAGYKIVFQQIRTNNNASLKLHTKLGFEAYDCIFRNRNDNEVRIYLKSLL